MPDDAIERRIAEVLTRDRSSGLCPLDGPCTSCDCFDPLHEYDRANAKAVMAEVVTAELGRLRNRITALEANGSELLARAEGAERELTDMKQVLAEEIGAIAEERITTRRVDVLELIRERDALKRGGKELGKIVDFLGDLIKDAYLRGADDPIDAVHMLGNCLAELLEGEGGLPADEHNRVYRALEDQRAKQDAPRTPESTADAPSPVSAATEAHGETTEAQEG